MYSGIRKRLTYTNVAMTLALVFAMTGGAYAASKGFLITSLKQIKPSVVKQLQGKAGANGVAGSNGVTGAAGPQGAAGAAGVKGDTGATGPEGKVGPEGPKGEEGSPWTAGGTLPGGKTETGAWSFTTGPENNPITTISFTLPLKAGLTETQVNYVSEKGNGGTCPGSAAKPEATADNLCLYQGAVNGVELENGIAAAKIAPIPLSAKHGTATSGALIIFPKHEKEETSGWGTWAVTAEE